MALSGAHMLEQVKKLYHGRRTGDQSAFAEVLAPGAEFHFMGNESVVRAFPAGDTDGATDPNVVAGALFDQIAMNACEFGEPIAQGHRLAVVVTAQLQVEGRPAFAHDMFDLWEFNEAGQVIKGQQFQDTAKIIEELGHRP